MRRRKESRRTTGNKVRKRCHKTALKWRYLSAALCALLFTAGAGAACCFSDNTRIAALLCSGNFYYTPQQIYDKAGIYINASAIMNTPSRLEEVLEKDPLIKEASISLIGRKMTITINEELVIGYYTENNKTYLLLKTGQSVPLSSSTPKLANFPLLQLNDEQRQKLCQAVEKYADVLTRELISSIAEISIAPSSYDAERLCLQMQDGNTVYSSYNGLKAFSDYKNSVPYSGQQHACFVLLNGEDYDYPGKVMAKITSCDRFSQDTEASLQNQAIANPNAKEEDEKQKESGQSEQNQDGKDKDGQGEDSQNQDDQNKNDDQKDSDQTSEQDGRDSSGQPDEAQSEQADEPVVIETDDWQECDYSWLDYSPAYDVYRDKNGTQLWVYDNDKLCFVPLQ